MPSWTRVIPPEVRELPAFAHAEALVRTPARIAVGWAPVLVGARVALDLIAHTP